MRIKQLKIPLLLVLTLLALTGCWGVADNRASLVGASCSPETRPSTQCGDNKVIECRDGTWQVVRDCRDVGRACSASVNGTNPSCSGEPLCSSKTEDGKCALGASCGANEQCGSGVCGATGTCLSSSCGNGTQDSNETGTDCGGPCLACEGESCSGDSDCKTTYCLEGTCSTPSCTDEVQNGTETDTDCGGECEPCPNGKSCEQSSDCQSGRCQSGTCEKVPASCEDGEQNGSESDVDCGGSSCSGCQVGESCNEDLDCESDLFCNAGQCQRPTCNDGMQNQNEAAVDCGGPNCSGCEAGTSCRSHSDCLSERCSGGQCVSCRDGVQNGGESGGDCGGPCRACADGQSCQSDSDCAGGKCENGQCCTPNRCGFCGELPEETCNGQDDDCDGQVDEGLQGPLCDNQKGACEGARATCQGASGFQCNDAAFRNHDSAYRANKDIVCDEIDNDCDGETDEDPCPSGGSVCYEQVCERGKDGPEACIESNDIDSSKIGYACSSDPSSNSIQYCNAFGCTPMHAACVCDSYGCTAYRWTGDRVDSWSVSGCECEYAMDGVTLKNTSTGEIINNCQDRCRKKTEGNETHYSCDNGSVAL